jgi:hypothetical protein
MSDDQETKRVFDISDLASIRSESTESLKRVQEAVKELSVAFDAYLIASGSSTSTDKTNA